ncbi:MAG: Clp protease N-terminal domain-containing protein [Candidatus Doudnabacteria bacterium]|jgi:hypothetical protein
MTSLNQSLKYQYSSFSPWGISALYEGYLLEFSGAPDKARIGKEKLRKFLPFLKTSAEPTNKKIIQSVDLYTLFSPSAKTAWNQACEIALKHKREMAMEDLFLALLNVPSVIKLFAKLKIDISSAKTFLTNYIKLSSQTESKNITQVPFEAFLLASKLKNHKIGSLMLLGGLLRLAPQDNVLQAIFSNIGLTVEKLEILIVWILNLDYEFPANTPAAQTAYCCMQAQGLEDHFGYFFEFPAVDVAVKYAQDYFQDLRHQKALQFLVRAGNLAKTAGSKIITEKLVRQAAGK